jgi:hypothetical protein
MHFLVSSMRATCSYNINLQRFKLQLSASLNKSFIRRKKIEASAQICVVFSPSLNVEKICSYDPNTLGHISAAIFTNLARIKSNLTEECWFLEEKENEAILKYRPSHRFSDLAVFCCQVYEEFLTDTFVESHEPRTQPNIPNNLNR